VHRIEHYETPDGSDPIQEWLGKLRDKRKQNADIDRAAGYWRDIQRGGQR
jgi:hypothetical protein